MPEKMLLCLGALLQMIMDIQECYLKVKLLKSQDSSFACISCLGALLKMMMDVQECYLKVKLLKRQDSSFASISLRRKQNILETTWYMKQQSPIFALIF